MQIDNPESWKISAEERAKHTATFMQLNPATGGLLSGDQAKAFFLKSGLPMPVLGQIWNLADLNKDGKLDVKEFSIACFLIKRALTSPQGPACIPPTLPHSLLVDPTIAATPIIGPPKTNIVLPATTTPLIGASPLIMPSTTTTTPLIPASSNTPLFQANFPPMSQTPIVGLSAPHTTATATPLVGLGTTPLLPLGATATSPPLLTQLAPASTSTPMAPLTSGQLPGAVFTPLVPLNQPSTALPNPLSPIPQTSRSKYGQMFQSNDPTSSGFITGNQARTLLMQTGLAQPILAQIWNLADYDKDGKLTYEEFILAMHLCDYAKTGATLPGTLPADLIPPRSRSSSLVGNSIAPALTTTLTTAATGGAVTGFDAIAAADASPTLSAKQQGVAVTFEDKRRENFDRGAAVLEAKRAALREQEEREKREREEKERLEQEKRQRIREEQEKRRLAEIERAQERQRQIDAQREEERRKAHEQREQARNELIRQQRLEWEKQKRLELEQTRLKLQEQLSTLKAKDKNLEYDLHALNDKISSYKTKISDNQTNLTELNQRLDVTKKSYAHKQGECEVSEKELKEITQMLARLGQEKLVLNEQLKNLNADSPFAEEYRNDSHQLKQKQSAIQQLRAEVEAIETRINSTRTQLEIVRHELEVTRGDEADYERENERLRSLLDIKRGVVPSNKIPASMSNGSLAKQVSNSANIMKSSQSNGSLRSATPKGPTNTTTNGGVKNAVDFFNSQQQPVSSPTTKNSTMTPSNSFQQRLSSANSIKYRAMYQFDASRDDELSIKEGDIVNVDISVKTDDGWVWGELNGKTGVFPAAFAAKLSDLEGHSQPDYSALGNVNLPIQSGANVAADSHIKNYYMSVYAYESSEPGDLVFGEYEIINVVSQNEDWFTGEVVGAEQSRRGIFPTNFVIKFNLPLEYIGKYTISIATEIYAPMNPGELSLDPNHNQLIAIKKVSPDGKWSFGESYDTSGKMSRGWFPIGSASALIPSGATPLYSPNQSAMSNGPKSPTAANGASLATNNISTASSPEPPPPTSTTSPSSSEAVVVAEVATADVADSATTVASVAAAIATDNDGTTSAANNVIIASSTVTTNNNHTNGSNGTSNGVEKPTTVKKSTTNGSISSTSKTVASSENRAQTPPQIAAESVAQIEKSPSSPSTTSGSQGANDSGASQQSPPSTAAAAPPTQVIDRVVALYDFNPTTPEAIGFPKDAVINILDKSGDWWYGEYNGKIGILPYNYVQSIATDNPTTTNG